MQRYDFYFRQKVTEGELDEAFDAVEAAISQLLSDFSYAGVSANLEVVENQPSPTMAVLVTGPGIAYDQDGNRIFVPSTQTLNCAVDENNVNTVVNTPGRSRVLSIFAEFDRTLTDPRIDGNNNTVYYDRAESFALNVVQGAEFITGDPGVYPALRPDQVLLADIIIDYNQTSILDADIDMVARRQLLIQIPGGVIGGLDINAATPNDALEQILDAFNQHISGAGYDHNAADLQYGGGGTWANGGTNPATTVELQLDKIISDLASASGTDGAVRLGLTALGVNWADGTVPTVGTIRAALVSIVTLLGGSGGAAKIGATISPAWADGATDAAGTLISRVDAIVTRLADQVGVSNDDGIAKIGAGAATGGFAWADGLNFSNGTLRALLLKIVTDLASTGATSGADRIGVRALTYTNDPNPLITITAAPLKSALQVVVNYLHNFMQQEFYARIAAAQFRAVAAAAIVAGDGIVSVDYCVALRTWFAVRRVAAGNDIIYRGFNPAAGIDTADTVTSTTIIGLRANSALGIPLAVGSRNPTSGGGLLVYFSASTWNTATLAAPATTSGAVVWDAMLISWLNLYVLIGHDTTRIFFQSASSASPGGTWTDRTVTSTNVQPVANCLATDGASSIVAVASGGWIFYSSNGTVWSRVQISTINWKGVCWNPTRGRYYAVGSAGDVYISNDATGATWTQVTLPAGLSALSPIFCGIACDPQGRMVFHFNIGGTSSWIGCTVDFFGTFRVYKPEGTGGLWEANEAGTIRYTNGRFCIGDFPTSGKGACVITDPAGDTLIS
jgi:hypothetical protein